jgi:hypothetical protein
MRGLGFVSVLACVLIAIGAGSCGDDDEDASQDFASADLERLSFARDELPEMEYQPDSSGLGAFREDQQEEAKEEGDRSGLELVESLDEIGLEEDYVSQFFAFERGSELSFVESIVFLFPDEAAAEEAVDEVEDGAARNIEPAEEIEALDVGEDGFGLSGEFEGFPTYSFGWRVGDVIQLLGVAPSDPKAGFARVRAVAQQLEAKATEE